MSIIINCACLCVLLVPALKFERAIRYAVIRLIVTNEAFSRESPVHSAAIDRGVSVSYDSVHCTDVRMN